MPAGDSFASPVVLTGTTGTAGIDNTGASYETGEPANSLGADGAASVWFRVVLGANDGFGWYLHAATSGDPLWDSTIEAFTGTTLGGLTLIDSDDDIDYSGGDFHSAIDYDSFGSAIPDGTTVWIRVDGWNDWGGGVSATTATGLLTWSVEAAPPPPSGSLTLYSVRDPDTGSAITQAVIGSTVVLVGNDLTDVFRVYFGTAAVTAFTLDDPTHISVVVPADATADPGGAISILDHTGLASPTAFRPLYPGPWITPTPIYGETVSSGWNYETSNRNWTNPGTAYLAGPDGSVPDGIGVLNGTASHGYQSAAGGDFPHPESAIQGAGYITLAGIMDEPDFDLAFWLDPEPSEVLDPEPPDAVAWEWQNPTLNNGTFLGTYRLLVHGTTGPTSDTDPLQMRRLAPSEYTRYDAGSSDPTASIASSWHLPSDLAAKDLLFEFSGPPDLSEAEILGHIDIAAADLDGPDGVLAFVPTIASYVAGGYAAGDQSIGIRDLFPQLLYQPDNFRWLFVVPPTTAGWQVGSVAMT